MKRSALYSLAAVFIFISCRKTRTCSCSVTETITKNISPQSGASPTVQINPSTGYTTKNTQPNITKKEMRRFENCNSQELTTSKSYTHAAITSTSSIEPSNILEVSKKEFDCKIK